MDSQITAFIALMVTSGVINLVLAVFAYARRHYYKSIAWTFIIYILPISIYCFAGAFGLLATNIEQIKTWTIIQYIGIGYSPLLGLLFILRYFGMETAFKRVLLLLIIPTITIILVATNDLHHLYYRTLQIDPLLGAPYVEQEVGIWYIVHGIFTFSFMFIALILTLLQLKTAARAYWKQIIVLALGQFLPIVMSYFYLTGLTPSGIDPVPMILGLSSTLYLWAITTSQMFTVVPIAKDVIFQSMDNGVIVLDNSYRLVEYNQAAQKMLIGINQQMYGQNFYHIWKNLSGLPFPYSLSESPLEAEITYNRQHKPRVFQLRVSPLSHTTKNSGRLVIFTDITKMKNMQTQLEYLAYYDELTNILNRRAFFQRAEIAISQAKKSFAILLFDIDHFKKINDTYGHQVGDRILNETSQLFRKILPDHCLLARYGGEEFILTLNDMDIKEAYQLAETMRQQLEEHPFKIDSLSIPVTISLGISSIDNLNKHTLEQLLYQADQALYLAKERGRNQVQIFS
ncbi:histidine kinase N-terminal 7TM domain-containing diguanylate cyclase [Gracilibacillus phocaeensis]|uniref:histidine kinase N-terminal 7TM domain-containing diguanylate cyclase n=1 Tax=Gracilibacillus phocaeensis TaxID=2042304 RepID=UPI001031895E|nr:diguanylate cyclase [Gracilibacillus phocaeensis]